MYNFLAFLRKKKTKKTFDENTPKDENTQQIIVTSEKMQDNSSVSEKVTLTPEPEKNDAIEISSTQEVRHQPIVEKIEDKLSPNEPGSDIVEYRSKKSFSNNTSHVIPSSKNQGWLIVTASAIGKSHLESNIPCQDNHNCESINESWGIAITSDGAGSAANSHIGSAYITNEIGIKTFKNLVVSKGWHQSNNLPTTEEWRYLAREACIEIYNELDNFAKQSNIDLSSLACTLIVAIYSPVGLMVTHIGDGRAGYCNEAGEWKSLLTPHKGEEANQTIFITSDKWITDITFLMSGRAVPESNIITEKASAFAIMTDGCELHSFECSKMNAATNRWYDPNIPYAKFFNPLVKNLRGMYDAGTSAKGTNSKWRKFMESGTTGLATESDDKTMILGIII